MSDYPRHIYEAYDEMLDDCFPEVAVFGWTVSPSVAFKRIDPIAYEVGLNDWLSQLEADGDFCPSCEAIGYMTDCTCEEE
jgi:hypothetical protein